MPNDYFTLKTLVCELSDTLAGGRINKINMPSEDEVYMDLRAKGKNFTLVLCARKPFARLHLTTVRAASPATPTAFCMLLRKHLTGGVIEGFSLFNNDRIAVCDISSRNELHDLMRYKLFIEIGGSPNLILTKDDLIIVDCLHRAFCEGARVILPNLLYSPPAQTKPNLFEEDPASLEGIATAKDIIAKFVGVSRETSAEIEYLTYSKPLVSVIKEFNGLYNSSLFSPSLLTDKDGVPKGFFAFPYQSVKEGNFIKTDSLSDAIDRYYCTLHQGSGKSGAVKSIRQTLKKLKANTEKKLSGNAARLTECASKDRFLQLGELIKCNAHLITYGQKAVTVYDFYNDNEITIEINPLLTPMKNAAFYFRKYAKLKGAEAYAVKEKTELKDIYEYLLNIEESLDNCTTETEYAEIAAELALLTGNRTVPQKNAKKQKASEPIRIQIEGYTVYIGKNNTQNDMITYKVASGRDLWLHAKGYHGSHGIIITNGKEVAQSVIVKVAAFVAYMSQAKNTSKAEVDYTRRTNVKRLGKPGLVTYTDYKTVSVQPAKLDKL